MEKGADVVAYADSIIQITQDSESIYYPTTGYILRGNFHKESGNYSDAIDDYMMAYELSLKKQNDVHQRKVTLAMADIQRLNGQPEAAINLYEHSLSLLQENPDYEVVYYEEYVRLLYELTSACIMASEFDFASIYVEKGRSLTNSISDLDQYKRFTLKGAEVNFHIGNIQQANDTILRYNQKLEPVDRAVMLYYLGKIHESENSELATHYFERVDSIISHYEVPFDRTKELYKKLIFQSTSGDSTLIAMEYLKKFLYHDSLSILTLERLEPVSLFDSTRVNHQKKLLEEKLQIINAALKGVLTLAFMATIFSLHFFSKYRTSRPENLPPENEIKGALQRNPSDHLKNIPPEIAAEIKRELDSFEKSILFLDKDLRSKDLAEHIGTNSRNLSNVIRYYKGCGFSTYIRFLRIHYAIKQLKKNSDLIKYTIKGLADKFGFSSGKSFSRAFQSTTGIYLSKFLIGLKRANKR